MNRLFIAITLATIASAYAEELDQKTKKQIQTLKIAERNEVEALRKERDEDIEKLVGLLKKEYAYASRGVYYPKRETREEGIDPLLKKIKDLKFDIEEKRARMP